MHKARRHNEPAARARERARTPEAKEQLRTLILREAVALFVEAGYTGFSMRKLAERLPYSATTLYTYFTNKDDLLFAIIGEGYTVFRSYLTTTGADPIERLEAVGTAYMDFAFRNSALYRLMFIQRPGSLFDLSDETVQTRMGILRGVVEKARQTPFFAHVDEARVQQAVELFWAMLHGLVSLALTIPLFDETWARRNLKLFSRALRPLLSNRGDAAARPSRAAAEH